MRRIESVPVGIVIERRPGRTAWQAQTWQPVAVLPGAADTDRWKALVADGQVVRYHAATLPLELHRKETEGYRYNLSQEPPRVFVVLRASDSAPGDFPYAPFLVTASPYEAEAYLNSGEEIVEPVPMPDSLIAFVQAFVDTHHVDEPFVKRQRRRADKDAFERAGGSRFREAERDDGR